MKDIMIDVETLGTTPNSVILNIAAVCFDRENGVIGSHLVLSVHPNQNNRRICKKTLRWWFDQPTLLRVDAFCGRDELRDSLAALAAFIDDETVWSQGIDFDFGILDHAYRQCGMQSPWQYNAKRDTRTVYDVCGFDPKTIERKGDHHDALSDCYHQIKCVVAALNQQNQES